MANEQEPPSPEPGGEIAGERHHHGGGDDIGGEHPGDLVGGGAEGAEHMRDRHVDDGDVEHFEHRGQHHGDDERDRRTIGMVRRRRGRLDRGRWWFGSSLPLRALCAPRLAPSSFLRLAPARWCRWSRWRWRPRGAACRASGALVILMRTGKRWVTLTQLPVAFSGGSTEKVAPEPALMLSTTPSSLSPGYMSRLHAGLLALPDAGEIGLLEIGVDPPAAVLDDGEGGCAGLHDGARPQAYIGRPNRLPAP